MNKNKIYKFTHFDFKEYGSLIDVEVFVYPRNPIFIGHFPNHPILPGVVYIDMAKKLTLALNPKILYIEFISIKFLHTYSPTKTNKIFINCNLKVTDRKTQFSLSFKDNFTNNLAKIYLNVKYYDKTINNLF